MGAIVKVRDVIPAGHPQPYGFSLTSPPSGSGLAAEQLRRAFAEQRRTLVLFKQAVGAKRRPPARVLERLEYEAVAACAATIRARGGAS